MRVAVLTMKHTGTHFLMNHLKDMGLQQAFIHPSGDGWESKPNGKVFYQLHVEERLHFQKNIRDEDLVLSTIRDPRDVWYSHGHRRPWTPEGLEAQMLYAFERFDEAIIKHSPFLVRVDDPSCRIELHQVARWIGADDWEYGEVDRNSKHEFDWEFDVPESIKQLAKKWGYK